MSPKTEIQFLCQNCGFDSPRWLGKCPACNEWNTFVEEKVLESPKSKAHVQKPQGQKPVPITKVEFKDEERVSTSIAELDRVLGGGVVAGSVVLAAGEPGIGKSTLMLQIAESLSKRASVLYVSGEESLKQIRLRAQRLGTLSASLQLLSETDLFAIEHAIGELKPNFVIVDSIQTTSRGDLPSAAGSVSQVRECAAYLTMIAKQTATTIFIVGHVTKEGAIAGPRTLEHIVDVVLYFEGERHKQFRILRGIKNRFGATNEVGIFEMTEKGLIEVKNPSEVFLSERAERATGSVITATLEGTRPLLVEVQALVSPSTLQMPRRTVTGIDYNRASIIIAVLERRAGLKLGSKDIYVNVAGGVNLEEPAADLPLAVSIASCYKDIPVDAKTVVIGEVGLGGEVRAVHQVIPRIKEAEKLGFKRIIIPKGNAKEISSKINIDVGLVADVSGALRAVLK
jgi:DNA repair protein RadA/Sms